MPSPKAGAQTQVEMFHRIMASKWGHFPELTIEQNRVIWEAREKGWDVFWPSYPSAMSQAENTHKGAVAFLKSLS